jgi:hypothetical protein
MIAADRHAADVHDTTDRFDGEGAGIFGRQRSRRSHEPAGGNRSVTVPPDHMDGAPIVLIKLPVTGCRISTGPALLKHGEMPEAVGFVALSIAGRYRKPQPGAGDEVCRKRVERNWWHGGLL